MDRRHVLNQHLPKKCIDTCWRQILSSVNADIINESKYSINLNANCISLFVDRFVNKKWTIKQTVCFVYNFDSFTISLFLYISIIFIFQFFQINSVMFYEKVLHACQCQGRLSGQSRRLRLCEPLELMSAN